MTTTHNIVFKHPVALTGRTKNTVKGAYMITAETHWELHIHKTYAAANESKHNDNCIKGRQAPSKNIEILIRLYLIFNNF
jgi:hypothetical protein